MLRSRSHLRMLPFTLVALALAPSSASAVTASITGDSGEAVPLTGASPTVHTVAPELTFSFDADETSYSFSVKGPAGDDAAAPLACNTPGYATPEDIWYRGNGAYTGSVFVSKTPDDTSCATTTETRFTFSINASTTVLPPPGILKTAANTTSSLISYPFPVQVVPGADSYDVQYAVDAKLNPDGSIAGE